MKSKIWKVCILITDGRRSSDSQERPRHLFSSCELNHSKLDNFINDEKIISFLIWKWIEFCIITQKFCVFSPKLSSYSQTVCLHSRKFCVYFAFLSLRKIFVFFKKDFDVFVQFFGKKYFSHCFICKRIIFLITSYCPLSVRLSMLMLPVFSTSDKTFGGGGLIFSHQQKIIVSLEKLDSMILGMQWNNLNQKRQNYYWVKENQIVK